MFHFVLLAPWNVLPRGYDSFFLPFESHLFQEVPLRYEFHTLATPPQLLLRPGVLFPPSMRSLENWSCLLISLVPSLTSPNRMLVPQRQDLVSPVLPISRARTGHGIWQSLKYLLNEHRMDSIQENFYPATLPELSLFPSLGGLLKGSPKGCWGRPTRLGQGSSGQIHLEPPEAVPGKTARAWSVHGAFGLTRKKTPLRQMQALGAWLRRKCLCWDEKGPLSLERCSQARTQGLVSGGLLN